MSFIEMYELPILRWLHIVAMVYWLGGEWGVFQTSYHVVNRKLAMEERRRHMQTAYKIDILARTGIILLLPLGLHMGHLWGVQPYGGSFLTITWLFFAGWLALCWSAYYHRETDLGIKLTKFDEAIRYLVIPALMIASVASMLGYGPFAGAEGQKWFSIKIFIFSWLLVIGLLLRFIMREWTIMFRRLDEEGDNDDVENQLLKSIRFGRRLAYVYWIGILTVAFFGAVKPL
ncbi:hypothetical protein E2K93_09320 [Thalassotalea sp. HSM 43]|uniref:hypothetical protein n=1 Tax=Thalassotalea sp. HSM 43 TaxID=2552945 RepID=UPI0010820AB1|nr:hypothetical protein [Thalassotalea sp. HSM 43]QBY04575.1 hypothetical protein E2K93_09320 [Thalassotalea sp. HSM 43]